jgi:hypothetical protein
MTAVLKDSPVSELCARVAPAIPDPASLYLCIVHGEGRRPLLIRPFSAASRALVVQRAMELTLSAHGGRGYEVWSEAKLVAAYHARPAVPPPSHLVC